MYRLGFIVEKDICNKNLKVSSEVEYEEIYGMNIDYEYTLDHVRTSIFMILSFYALETHFFFHCVPTAL
jgi:hypothetical protein